MRRFALLALLALVACVQPAAPVQYGPGKGEVLADAVAIRGIRGEVGQDNSAANAAIASAEANWLSVQYPGWSIVGKRAGVDGSLGYHAVSISNGPASRTVYFDVSEYMWSVAPA